MNLSDSFGTSRTSISKRDPRIKKLSELRGQLSLTEAKTDLFGNNLWPTETERLAHKTRLTETIKKVESEMDDTEKNKLYASGFEWRFEFPEVLDDEGNYRGFDLIVGNPPYISHDEIKYKKEIDKTYTWGSAFADISIYFFEAGLTLIRPNSELSFITTNSVNKAEYGNIFRKKITTDYNLEEVIDFGDLKIFKEATVNASIISVNRSIPNLNASIRTRLDINLLGTSVYDIPQIAIDRSHFTESPWRVLKQAELTLLAKLRSVHPTLQDLDVKIRLGIATGMNEAFILDR